MTQATPRPLNQGMALIAVLWLVAALSLMVAGLLSTVRGELRDLGDRKERLHATAWGDAALLQALQQMHVSQQTQWARPNRWNLSWEGQPLVVELRPASGWINPNTASAALLADLLHFGAGLPKDSADLLGQQITRLREPSQGGVNARFDNPADLMRVPGLSLEAYAKIESSLSTAASESGKVNPLAAPPQVLKVLTQENLQRATQLQAAQFSPEANLDPAQPPPVNTTDLNPEHLQSTADSTVRLSVRVGPWLRVWWVNLGAGTGALPWQVLEQQTLAAP